MMEPLIKRFSSSARLTENDLVLLRSLSDTAETFWSGSEILSEGQLVRRPRIIVSGWACLRRDLPDGRRQIFGFLVPGDCVGVSAGGRALALASTIALTTLKTVDAERVQRRGATLHEPTGLSDALHSAATLETALLLDHIVRLGRMTAIARVAHLFLELRHRLAIVGLANANRLPLPMTQETLAECLGLSSVHLNRSLQQLKRDKLIELKGGAATLLQLEALAQLSDFEPTVLPSLPSASAEQDTGQRRVLERRTFLSEY